MKKTGNARFDTETVNFDTQKSVINGKVSVEAGTKETWSILKEMTDTMLGHGSHTSHSSKWAMNIGANIFCGDNNEILALIKLAI